MTKLPPDIGPRLRAARAYRSSRYSQTDLGRDLSQHANTVKAWENGAAIDELKAPEVVKRAAAATGLPEWFFTVPRLSNVLRGAASPDAPNTARSLNDLQTGIDAALEMLRGLLEDGGEDQQQEHGT